MKRIQTLTRVVLTVGFLAWILPDVFGRTLHPDSNPPPTVFGRTL
jgi:hypothetical protein